MDTCKIPNQCLRQREVDLRTNPESPCQDCPVGTARQTMAFVPSPGFGPNCLECFGPNDGRRAVCYECANEKGYRANNNPRPRKNVKAYWGYQQL